MLLDGAYTDEAVLAAVLGESVGGEVRKVAVHKVDLVNDTTLVDVRWRSAERAPLPEALSRSASSVAPTAVGA